MSYEYNGSLHVDLVKAIAHHKDAGDAIDDIPDRDDDPEGHAKAVRSFHAHVKAADDCLDDYRHGAGIVVDPGVDIGPDPESGSSPEERRRRLGRLRQP